MLSPSGRGELREHWIAPECRTAPALRLIVETTAPTELTSLQRVWADQGYSGAFAEWFRATPGWQLEVVRHAARQARRYGLEERPTRRFQVLPRRWVVERAFAWLS